MNTLQAYLQKEQKKTLLDIGTGAGNFIHQLTSIYDGYESFIGIDTHEKLIEMAQKNAPNEKISFERMDAYGMTFPDQYFDVVCLSNSLHHITDISEMFQAMKRVLKDDGFILIQEMIQDQLNPMQESHKMMHHFAARIDRLHGEKHDETFTEQEIIDIVQSQSGLFVEKAWLLDVPLRSENNTEELNYILNILERLIARVPEEHIEAFSQEKDSIKEYITKHGYDSCPSLCAILKKTSL